MFDQSTKIEEPEMDPDLMSEECAESIDNTPHPRNRRQVSRYNPKIGQS